MTVQSSGDGRLVSDMPVNRSVLFSHTGLLWFAQFCHAFLGIGVLTQQTLNFWVLLEIGLNSPLIFPRLLKRRKLNVKANTPT